MRFRKLRIAWSVFWGLAAVLLIVLWMRSYWTIDYAGNLLGHDLVSVHGNVIVDDTIALRSVDRDRIVYVGGVRFNRFHAMSLALSKVTSTRAGKGIAVPHWALVFALMVIASPPWLCQMPWRFSLRTLLIAMTLVAVVLGLIVWLR